MIVLRDTDSLKVFYPRMTIRSILTLTELYGNPLQPLTNRIPKLADLVFILSLCLAEYDLCDDKIYDIVDTVDNLSELIVQLYIESGLINQDDTQEETVEQEDTNNESDNEQPLEVDIKQQIDELLEQCMSIGMSESDFYNSTFKQVKRYAESYNNREKAKMKEQAFFDYQLANMIGTSVARLFSNDVQYPRIEEVYPGIFDDNNTSQEESTNSNVGVDGMTAEEREIEINRIKMLEWAKQQNDKRKKQEQSKDRE